MLLTCDFTFTGKIVCDQLQVEAEGLGQLLVVL